MGKWTITALALSLAAGGTCLVKPEIYTEEIPKLWGRLSGKPELKGGAWADPEALRDELSQRIEQKLGGKISEDAVRKFLKSADNRLMLAQWMAAQSEVNAQETLKEDEEARSKEISKLKDSVAAVEKTVPEGASLGDRAARHLKRQKEKLAALEAEAMLPHSMLEVVNTPEGNRLMELLGNDERWMEQFAFTGECVRPGVAASILSQLARKNPSLAKSPMERDIATATALEFARSNWLQEEALKRAEFFAKNWKAKRLNVVFEHLPFWQRRMVCGCKGDNDFGSPESLQWALDNVNLPADQYGSCCWRCGYKLFNLYGMSIHGPGYFEPFDDQFGRNRMAATFYVGGVCGGLSHFGAFSALAHGIPATTAGEPGHCAFVVLVGDEWRPAYSLSWKRGLHWPVWKGIGAFSSLHVATELYSKEQEKATRLGQAYRVLGGVYAAKKDVKRSAECYKKSILAQPRNVSAWREWAGMLSALASEPSRENTAAWRYLNNAACKEFAPRFPELAAVVLRLDVYPGLAKALADDPSTLRSDILSFWKRLKVMGPDRWRVEELADGQLKALGVDPEDADALCGVFGEILGSVASSPEYSPIILAWGDSHAEKLPAEGKEKFMAAMIEGLGKGKDLSADDRDKVLAPAILAAEQARDLSTFQALGGMLSPAFREPKSKLPEHKPFPGKLASRGGMIWTSSTSKYENPCSHWGVLEPSGGHFHTGKDKDAYVVVEMPRQVNVTGIVIIATGGANMRRLNNMKIQVSETGKDDDWTDVAQLGDCKQRVNAVDLSASLPLAKYVRVLRPGGPEFFHLNAIFVYGNQAA